MSKSLYLQVLVSSLTLLSVSGLALMAHAEPASQVETIPDVIYSNRPFSPALQAQMSSQYPTVKVVMATDMPVANTPAAIPAPPSIAGISPASGTPVLTYKGEQQVVTGSQVPVSAQQGAQAPSQAAPVVMSTLTAPAPESPHSVMTEPVATQEVKPVLPTQVLPESTPTQLSNTPVIAPMQAGGSVGNTPEISANIAAAQNDAQALQKNIAQLTIRLSELQKINQIESANYYKNTVPMPIGAVSPQNQAAAEQARTQRAQQNIARLQENAENFKALSGDIAAAAQRSSALVMQIQSKAGAPETTQTDRTQLSMILGQLNEVSLKLKTLQENTDKDSQQVTASLSGKINNVAPAAGPNPSAIEPTIANRSAVQTLSSVTPIAASALPAPALPAARVAVAPSPAAIAPATTLVTKSSQGPILTAPPRATLAAQSQGGGTPATQKVALQSSQASSTAPSAPQPLVKIHYTGDKVNYEQAVYAALQKALQKFPNAEFDVRGVYPATSNAAQAAIDSTKSLRNAQQVITTMTGKGIPQTKFGTPSAASASVTGPQVQIFIR